MLRNKEDILRYCPGCGKELLVYSHPADLIEYDTWKLDSAYDKRTGERIMATVYKCPDFFRRWGRSNVHLLLVEERDSERLEDHAGGRITIKENTTP